LNFTVFFLISKKKSFEKYVLDKYTTWTKPFGHKWDFNDITHS